MEQSFVRAFNALCKDNEKIVDELGVANAHPAGAKPFKRADYIRKFPDEDYLQAVQELARRAKATDPLHQGFLEKIIFDPFEGPRDNFFALNWRDRQI